jgi:DNA-binding IclR family transcriptional regulator
MLNESITDAVLTTVADKPGLTLRKIARALRDVGLSDAGVVRSAVVTLARNGYLAQSGKGGRETYRRA